MSLKKVLDRDIILINTRNTNMINDVLEIILNATISDIPRVDFMIKYDLTKTETVNYISQSRKDYEGLGNHLAYIGECCFNYETID